jgi:hypothetical protein
MSTLSNHSWPHPILTRIHEPGQKPTRERVLQNAEECHANAASITQSTLGAEGTGLLGITATDAEYLTVAGVAWVEPIAPPLPAAGGTQFEIAERQRAHTEAIEQWRLYLAVKTAIRNQLLASADDVYWTSLRQPLVGYGQRGPREFLECMTTRYAQFTENVRESTNLQMDASWTKGPFEVVINQINRGATLYSEAGQIMSDQIKCDKLYAIAKNSGRLSQACKKWRLRPVAQKTWINCTDFFQSEADDLDNDDTTSSAGYAANLVTQTAMVDATRVLRDMTNNQAHLASSQSSDRVMRLEAELLATKAQLQAFQESLKMFSKMQHGGGGGGGGRGKGNQNPGNFDYSTLPFYCHSHGHNRSHNSCDCKRPLEGHKKDANKANTMGGRGHGKV